MRLAFFVLLAAAAVLAVAAWRVRPLSVARGLGALEPPEAERLLAVLDTAEIDPESVRLVEADEPCERARASPLARWLRLDRATGRACVGVRKGRVESLRLHGARLRDLGPLAALPALRSVVVREGDLERIAAPPTGCAWRSLDVGRNRIGSIRGLEHCQDLTSLDVSQNQLRTMPALPPEVTDLVASGNPIADVSPLAGLDRLTTLVLRDSPLADLDAVPPLPALERLDLARSAIVEIDADTLTRWPKLTWLHLGSTPLATATGHFETASEMSDPGLRLGPTWVSVSQTPLAEQIRAAAVGRHDGRQRHPVADLPRGSGRWQGTRRSGRTWTGLRSRLDARGSAQWMTGAQSVTFDLDRGILATVTASVDAGRIRVYLREGDGYVYAEAIPGAPLELVGRLISGTDHYVFFLEAVGGRAEGIRWTARGG